MILAAVIYYIDFLHKKRGVYFFEVFGKNPITIYLFSEIFISVLNMIRVGDTSLHGWTFQNIFVYATPYIGSALSAIVYMLVCWYVGYWMDKKKIYIKV
jgi:predicted acyltransferase